jgi:hypothetical protein
LRIASTLPSAIPTTTTPPMTSAGRTEEPVPTTQGMTQSTQAGATVQSANAQTNIDVPTARRTTSWGMSA